MFMGKIAWMRQILVSNFLSAGPSLSVELSKNIQKIYVDNPKNDCERFLSIISSLLDCLPWYDALLHHYVREYGYSSMNDFWKKATKKEHQNLSRILTDEISKTTCIFI